jgi:hypothetical protein
VIIAVVAMRMMQPSVDDVIHVIAVRDRLMPTVRTVHVACLLAGCKAVLASIGIGLADRDHVLVIMDKPIDLVRMMQMAVVEVVDVVLVSNRLVAAAGAVAMIVVRMGLTIMAHR